MEEEFNRVDAVDPVEEFEMDEQIEKKSITIRGIDTEVYDQFSSKIKTVGLNIGDAVSKMMGDVLTDFDENFPEISAKGLRSKFKSVSITHHEDLSINANDLTDGNLTYSFSHCNNLTFEEDVTKEIFMKHVKSVAHCNRVRVPAVLPKLQLLSKFSHVQGLKFYDVNKETED